MGLAANDGKPDNNERNDMTKNATGEANDIVMQLGEEEYAILDVVRDFVDRKVRPQARELEHANAYPEALIEQMKAIGIFGLAIPEPYGVVKVSTPCYALVAEELSRGWMSLAGAMGDTPWLPSCCSNSAPRIKNRAISHAWPLGNYGPPWPSPSRAGARTWPT